MALTRIRKIRGVVHRYIKGLIIILHLEALEIQKVMVGLMMFR